MVGGEPAITFRALRRDDLPRLRGWLTEPHVARWWGEPPADDAATAAKYGPMIDGDDRAEMFVFAVDGREVGVVQRYLLDEEPEWRAALAVALDPSGMAGIDYLIGEAGLVGHGIGPAMIDRFVHDLLARYPECDGVVVDVDPGNTRSWRALEKAGFRRIYDGDLFDPEEGVTERAVVYRLDRPEEGPTRRPASSAGA